MADQNHNLDACFCMANGERISGFGEGGAVNHTWAQDELTVTEGQDGEADLAKNNSSLGYAEITVRQTSVAHKILSELWQAQRSSSTIPRFAYRFEDTINGEFVSSPAAAIVGRPEVVFGRATGDRVWRLVLPDSDYSAGAR